MSDHTDNTTKTIIKQAMTVSNPVAATSEFNKQDVTLPQMLPHNYGHKSWCTWDKSYSKNNTS